MTEPSVRNAVLKNGKVVGYRLISMVNYTEDPEDYVVADYFLPNGVRFKGAKILEIIPREEEE